MPEPRRIKVQAYRTILVCDCGEEMQHVGMNYSSGKARYTHRCPVCAATSIEKKSYPLITYEAILTPFWDDD